jgi:hypothetical protein
VSSNQPACKYFEVCNFAPYGIHAGEHYCVLHLPGPHKNAPSFTNFLRKYLAAGKADFRHVTFPKGQTSNFKDVQIYSIADFREAVFTDGLMLQGAYFPCDSYLLWNG